MTNILGWIVRSKSTSSNNVRQPRSKYGGTEMQRWSRRAIVVGGVGCLLASCYQGWTGDVGYSVAVSGDGNQVAISHDASQGEGTYIVTVNSVAGIGQASTTWWGSTSPHQVYFHLHLNGLEQFSLRWIDQTVTLRVNSFDQSMIQGMQAGHQSERVISADSPYWMEVATPTPARSMYIVAAPEAFIAAAPKFWGIAWIDFYR